jgi:hypothetical protein
MVRTEEAFLWRMEGLTFKQIGMKMQIHPTRARVLYESARGRRIYRYRIIHVPDWHIEKFWRHDTPENFKRRAMAQIISDSLGGRLPKFTLKAA